MARTVSTQRTGLNSCAASAWRMASGCLALEHRHYATRYRSAGLITPYAARSLANFSAAGCIRLQCDGTETGRGNARLAPASFASSMARSTAAACPAITTWPGELKFTALTTSPCARPAHNRDEPVHHQAPVSPPSHPDLPAPRFACLARFSTSATASAKSMEPAQTSAVYSPRLCPAIIAGS